MNQLLLFVSPTSDGKRLCVTPAGARASKKLWQVINDLCYPPTIFRSIGNYLLLSPEECGFFVDFLQQHYPSISIKPCQENNWSKSKESLSVLSLHRLIQTGRTKSISEDIATSLSN